MNRDLRYIAEGLKLYPPCARYCREREDIFSEIDRILMDNSLTSEGAEFDIGGANRVVKRNPIRELYIYQIEQALSEIENCRVTEGIVVWQFYNMGYIIKTPTITIGFDIVPGPRFGNWSWHIPEKISRRMARALDILLVSHYIDNYHRHPGVTWYHTDHCDEKIVRMMARERKPVIIPTGHEEYFGQKDGITYARHSSRIEISGLEVTSFGGPHVYQDNPFETPLMVYNVVTREGIRLFFTGDFDYSRFSTVPLQGNIDILFLRCGGVSPLYDEDGPYHLGGDTEGFYFGLQEFYSRFVIPGHLAEMTHPPGGGRESYSRAYDVFSTLKLAGEVDLKYLVMFWGEKYHVEL